MTPGVIIPALNYKFLIEYIYFRLNFLLTVDIFTFTVFAAFLNFLVILINCLTNLFNS